MKKHVFAFVVVIGALTGCASTPHGQAVQQTAAGAVLLSGAVGGTAATVGGVVLGVTTESDAYIPTVIATGLTSAVLYAVAIPLLATGAHTLDAEAMAVGDPAVSSSTSRGTAKTKQQHKTKTKKQAADADGDDPRGTAAQEATFAACIATMCFAGDTRCADSKRADFEDAGDKAAWLESAGCNTPAPASTTTPTTAAPPATDVDG